MKTLLLVVLTACAVSAQAEDSTCTVKGMTCDSCAATVKEKVCTGDKWATCDVTYDAKTKTGMIHVVTKDMATKVDAKELSTAMAETTYKVASCKPTTTGHGKAPKKG